MDNEYFDCDCVYGKNGYILCKMCEIINEVDKNEFIKIKVKRWKNRGKQNDNKKKQTNGENENK